MRLPQSITRGTLAIATGACCLGGLALSAAAPASATGAAASGFAVVTGHEPIGPWSDLTGGASYISTSVSSVARLAHTATGQYEVDFPGLRPTLVSGAIGPGALGAHARANASGANCETVETLQTGGSDAGVLVTCFDSSGNLADEPFTVSYTTGGAETGQVISALTSGGSATSAQITPYYQQSSVGGSVTYNHPARGEYVFDLPYLSAAGVETLVATATYPSPPTVPTHPDVTCGITGKTTVSGDQGQVRRVYVSCRNAADGTPDDTKVSLTYARGVNALGVSGVGEANVTVPPLTATSPSQITLTGDQAYDEIYGVTGTVTVERNAQGTYTVDLPHMAWGLSQPSIMATADGSDAHCTMLGSYVTNNDTEHVTVACQKASAYVDTGFQLQYLTSQ